MTSLRLIKEDYAPKVLEIISPDILKIAIPTTAMLIVITLIVILHISNKLTRKSLSTRVAFQLLPTNTFDPRPEDVDRTARRLTRARPALWAMSPKRGSAVRVRIATSDDGKTTYLVEGPRSSESVLRGHSYSQVEAHLKEPQERNDREGETPLGR